MQRSVSTALAGIGKALNSSLKSLGLTSINGPQLMLILLLLLLLLLILLLLVLLLLMLLMMMMSLMAQLHYK